MDVIFQIRTALLLLVSSSVLAAAQHYALILQDPPAAAAKSVVRNQSGPEVVAMEQRLRQTQGAIRTELSRRNIRIIGSAQLLVNAVFVATGSDRVPELQRLPGVRRVVRTRSLHRALDKAEALVNTSAAWSVLGGVANAGSGVKVAVIDTGIDQTHPAFQDPALSPPAGYPKCLPEDCGFTNGKVIVARSYVRQLGAGSQPDPAADSRPDDFSPRDHWGHGTAVGMVIGGVTNTGPADTITGLAPKVFLGNYKVFGTPGVNESASDEVVIQALEDAVRDGMDIVNLSLGGPALTGALDSGASCGEAAGTACDLLAQAVENASSLGVLVVAAAGNDGSAAALPPNLGSVETPGIAPSAISVAASTNSHSWGHSASGLFPVDISNYNTIASFSSRGPALGAAASSGIKPEVTAVGTNMYLAGQNYDPNGDLYSASRYLVGSGTSFSSPMVAGAAALVKQAHPAWQPAELKSALVNTATQDLTDGGNPATIAAAGAGKLSAGNAVTAGLTVTPSTVSFSSASATVPLLIKNQSPATVSLAAHTTGALDCGTAGAGLCLKLDAPVLSIPPGQTARLTASLSGNAAPGSYEGFIVLDGAAAALRVPCVYLAGDGSPSNLAALEGFGGTGLVGQEVQDGMLAVKVVDQFGLPAPNVPVTFSVVSGGGQIANADPVTNQYGIATASALTGPLPGINVFVASASGLRVQLANTALAQPVISENGVVNSAGFASGRPVAPGSYVSIFGNNLATSSGGPSTAYLPVSIQQTSVSFDVPEAGLSVPGHLTYVSPQQVNVQIPWELAGQTSARVKVSINAASGAVYSVALAGAAPGIFTAVDAQYAAITASHPAMRGQTLILYGTGFGPVNHRPASGEAAPDATSNTISIPVVLIGGVPAPVQFSGLAPGYAGLYQINVTVPAEVPAGLQPVSISFDGIGSPIVQLPVQ